MVPSQISPACQADMDYSSQRQVYSTVIHDESLTSSDSSSTSAASAAGVACSALSSAGAETYNYATLRCSCDITTRKSELFKRCKERQKAACHTTEY